MHVLLFFLFFFCNHNSEPRRETNLAMTSGPGGIFVWSKRMQMQQP